MQLLAAKSNLIALLQKTVGRGHLLLLKAEHRGIGVGTVVFAHGAFVHQQFGTEFLLAPRVSRNVVEMGVRIDDIFDFQVFRSDVFLDLGIFVGTAVAGIDDHRLPRLVRHYVGVLHQRVEMERLQLHIHEF